MSEVAEQEPQGADEALYQQAMQELRSPRPTKMTGLVFVALFLLFVAGQFGNFTSASGIVVLVLAVAFHEAGHALGMRLFKFRDVKMFFIPFFGAAVSGRPRGAAAWKEALVSLLGPLPGIIAGFVCLTMMLTGHPTELLVTITQALLFLNVFNLLPFGFLDGGRFLSRVLFSRHRVLEVAFQAVGSLLLAIIAFSLAMYFLGVFALFGLAVLPLRWRVLSAAAALRQQHPAFSPDPDNLGEADGRALFAATRAMLAPELRDKTTALANNMEAIADAMKPAPRPLASVGLLGLYVVGLLLGLVALVQLVSESAPVSWTTVEQPDWKAEFPSAPMQLGPVPNELGEPTWVWRTAVRGTDRFTLEVSEAKADGTAARDRRMDQEAARLERDTGTRHVRTRPLEIGGSAGRELDLEGGGRLVRARMMWSGNRFYRAVASGPSAHDNHRRFLESVTLREPSPPPAAPGTAPASPTPP